MALKRPNNSSKSQHKGHRLQDSSCRNMYSGQRTMIRQKVRDRTKMS